MCTVCADKPIMHCAIFPNEHPIKGCFIQCPECGRRGNTTGLDFIPDPETAGLMRQVLDRRVHR